MLSFSALPLLGACQYWARDDVPRAPSEGNDATRMGNAGHRCCELEVARAWWDADSVFDEYGVAGADRADLALAVEAGVAFITENRRPDWRAEVAYAIDFATGHAVRLPPGEYHRDYRRCPVGYTPGTLDVVWEPVPGRVVAVLDWKFGFGGHVGDVKENLQLAAQALAAARAHGCEQALLVLVHVRATGAEHHEILFTADDLEAVRLRIVALGAAIATAEPQPGPHCTGRWCPAIVHCPETQALIAPLALLRPGLAKVARPTLDIQTLEQASAMVDYVALAKGWVRAAEEELHRVADARGGIPRPSGRTWRRSEQVTETADLTVPGALERVEQLGLAARVVKTLPWKALGKDAEAVRTALRAVGALKKGTRVVYDE